jgi:hypothetical protein
MGHLLLQILPVAVAIAVLYTVKGAAGLLR